MNMHAGSWWRLYMNSREVAANNFKWPNFCVMTCSSYVITTIQNHSEPFRTLLTHTESIILNQTDSLILSLLETSNIEFQHQGKIPKRCYSTSALYSIKQTVPQTKWMFRIEKFWTWSNNTYVKLMWLRLR